MIQFMQGADNVQWLMDTHLKYLRRSMPQPILSLILIGNEDCPDEIKAYAECDPTWDQIPMATFLRNDNGNLYYAGDASGHVWHYHEHDLQMCKKCHGAEGSFPRQCPDATMSSPRQDAVYAGLIDYRDNRWVNLKPVWNHPFGTHRFFQQYDAIVDDFGNSICLLYDRKVDEGFCRSVISRIYQWSAFILSDQ